MFNKDDIYGAIGSLAFHAVIFLILWFTVLKTVVPEEDGGVLVNFGNVDSSAGTFEPQYTGQQLPQETTTPPTPTPKVETPKEDLLTQDLEESVSLDDKKKEEEKRKKEEEEKKRKEAEEKERIRKQKEAEAKRIAEEQRKINIEVQKAIDAIAKERGIDLVLRGEGIAYAIPEMDISSEVITRVSAANKAK